MPNSPKKFYLTTPIYYVNARPHIGHAYSTIAADVIARRHRLLGEDVFFLTGTDEHGQKVQRSAAAAGIPPQQFADQVSKSFEDLWKRMGILDDSLSKNDPLLHRDFIRTTDPRHKRGVQKLWRVLEANGAIYLSSYTGAYCVSDEAFVDAPVGTPCPDCGRLLEEVTEENFFFKLSEFQEQLLEEIYSGRLVIKPQSAENEVLSFVAGPAITVAEAFRPQSSPQSDNWTIGLGLEQGVAEGSLKKIVSSENGKRKTLYYIPGHLKDLSISRSSFSWGIPVPDDIQRAAGATHPHVIYVWLDALANYITAIGYGSEDPADQAKFNRYWPADLHLVGKEITRFHCIYWPAFLMALRPPDVPPAEWNAKMLPKSVVANGWLLFEESKMSKSRGNVVRTETILDAFGPLCPPSPLAPATNAVILSERSESKDPDTANPSDTAKAISTIEPALTAPSKAQQDLFAADVLRYFLLREIPFGQDGSFSFDALITRYNADLANGYGNLVSRTLTMIVQYFSDGLPTPTEPWLCRDRQTFRDNDMPTQPYEPESGTRFIISRVSDFVEFSEEHLWPTNKLQIYLAELALRVSHVDHYLSFHKPWLLAKSSDEEDKKKLIEVLYTAAESIRWITALLYPVLPYATASVWRQLGLGSIEDAARNGKLKDLRWGDLQPGTKLGPLAPIFPRADKGLAQIMTDMENPTTPATADPVTADLAPAPVSSEPTAEALNAVSPTTAAPAQPAETTPTITIDDFAKIDLRVAQIIIAERIPKADKLLRLEVDLGPGFTPSRRQILSGIAEWYTPEELIGRRVAIIANLAPRKMRGLESHGMLLAASAEDLASKPILATFSDEIALGSRIR